MAVEEIGEEVKHKSDIDNAYLQAVRDRNLEGSVKLNCSLDLHE